MEKLSPIRAQLFLRNKYTVFTMGGTVALRSVNKKNPENYNSAATYFTVMFYKTVTMLSISFYVTSLNL